MAKQLTIGDVVKFLKQQGCGDVQSYLHQQGARVRYVTPNGMCGLLVIGYDGYHETIDDCGTKTTKHYRNFAEWQAAWLEGTDDESTMCGRNPVEFPNCLNCAGDCPPKLPKRITREQKSLREAWLTLAHKLQVFAENNDDYLATELAQLQRELCSAYFAQSEQAAYTDVLQACPMVAATFKGVYPHAPRTCGQCGETNAH